MVTFAAGQRLTAADLNSATLAGTIIKRHRRVSSSTGTTSGTGIGVIQLDAQVTLGRLYFVGFLSPCHLNSTITTDNVMGKIVYTTDGTTPTASSTLMVGAQAFSSPVGTPTPLATPWVSTVTGTLIIWVVVARFSGAGTATMYADASRSMEVAIIDLGVDTGVAGGSNL